MCLLNVCLTHHNPIILKCFFPIGFFALHSSTWTTINQQVMPDDHSKSVPPLPIPNRTVKRLRANDSAATSVKVGHRQAFIRKPLNRSLLRGFCFFDFYFLLPDSLCFLFTLFFFSQIHSSLWLWYLLNRLYLFWQPVGLRLHRLQNHLGGAYFTRFLVNISLLTLQIRENLPSSNSLSFQRPKPERLLAGII